MNHNAPTSDGWSTIGKKLVKLGGNVIIEESEKYLMKHKPLKEAQCAVTSGGKLNCKYIIHSSRPYCSYW